MGGQQSSEKITKKTKTVDLSDQNISIFPPIPKDNKLRSLNLTRNQIKELPTPLPKLRTLNVSYNYIGYLSQEFIAALLSYKKLEILDLSGNNLNEFPGFISHLKDLRRLNLFYNRIKKAKFECINTSQLEYLNLGHNSLVEIPELPKTVTTLIYDFNMLSHLNLIHPKLTYLSLTLVGLSSIDGSLQFPKLETLILSKNKLTSLPELSTFSPILEKLDISDNFFSYFPEPPKTIEEYNIKSNLLTEIPDILADFHSLYVLDVGDNKIRYIPQLPDTIEEFVFSQNQVVKAKESYTPNLKRLWLRENQLSEYPDYESMQLRDVTAGSNKFTEIDTDLINESTMRIDYSCNLLKSVPSDLFKLAQLTTVILHNNQIKSLPSSISNARILNILDVTNNPITEIPQMPPTLLSLYIGYCKISSFGSSLAPCTKLQILDAPGNLLTEIPTIPSLKQIYLSRNKFTKFPLNIYPRAVVLDLSCNNITSLPNSMNFPNLDELDLSFNSITNFPENFDCPKLKFLKLNSNSIYADLNPNLFKSLEILDVSCTGITFETEPEVRQLFVSEKLEQYVSRHVKIISAKSWVSFAEMKGVRDEMEDSICVNSLIQKDVDVYAVFDGHGGNKTSAFGSMFISDAYRSSKAKFTKRYLYLVMKKLERIIKKRNFGDGSTMAAALFNGRKILTAHIGDSRILVINNDGKVTFSTNDHKSTSRTEFERIHLEGGRVENMRVHGILAPGRSLGDLLVPGNSAEPEINSYEINDDDRWIIVCCDGVFDVLTNKFVGEMAAKAESATSLAFDIRNMAYACLSLDNITVIVVDIRERRNQIGNLFDGNNYGKINNSEDDKEDDESVRMIDFTDNEDIPTEYVHISFDLKDVDPSLYLSSGFSPHSSSKFNGNDEVPMSPLMDCGNLSEKSGTLIPTSVEKDFQVMTAGDAWRYSNAYVPNTFFSLRPEYSTYSKNI
ncbi:protein phosphatase 2C [Tritrichomonas foetus]|uniref:Protein phosphatase 2C n=1 Tax=Tritrichomonas foetus TaxID=1144522 RepID=A0A1J4J6Y9_9EUKA|nr:protein phosphatase 2C [Tritrichomonas foetus]|eukprot:OHS94994.1 protein phosphatase 2C [Tritrichomonas foetus]